MAKIYDVFDQAIALGRPVIRTNAFFEGTVGDVRKARIRNEHGEFREEGLHALDVLLNAAAENHIRLILVLSNHWSDYGGAPAIFNLISLLLILLCKQYKRCMKDAAKPEKKKLLYQGNFLKKNNGIVFAFP